MNIGKLTKIPQTCQNWDFWGISSIPAVSPKRYKEDRGHLLENAVYLELRRRNREVYVGKMRDKEVDRGC
jgi:predicted AAA+ superfamily ATPase